jgi:hypothetical protein
MIGAGDLAFDAELAAWEAMSDDERDAAAQEWLDDLAAAAQEWRESTERDAAQYAADVAADAAAEATYNAALMAEAERAQAAHIAAEDARIAETLVQVGPYVYADPKCRQCRGTGVVWDTVDYGSTTARLESPCDCATDYEWAIEDGDGITFVQGDVLNTDGVVLSAGEVTYEAQRNERGYMLAAYGPGELVTVHRYDSATWLLDHCAAIAPLSAWAVVYDDQGADDAPRG